MLHERSLSQLKVVEIEKYKAHHNLGKYGTKRAKLEAIKENIIQELAKRIEREDSVIQSEVNQKTAQRKKTVSLQRMVFQPLKRKRSRLKMKK